MPIRVTSASIDSVTEVRDVVIVGAASPAWLRRWSCGGAGRAARARAERRAGGVIVTERADGFVIDGGPDSLLVQKPAAR